LFTNEVQNLIDDSKLLVMIRNTGIISIKSNTNRTSILLSSSIRKKVFDKILTMLQINSTIYSINQENKFLIEMNEKDTSIRRNTIMNLINEIT
jgi:transcription-repair coupling factor (superfamily II helicase)